MHQMDEPGPAINEDEATRWLERYKSAWIERDAALVLPLFTEDVDYRERRFGNPLRNYDSLEDYWRARVGVNQRDVHFHYEIWAVRDDQCFAGFQAQFVWLPINGIMELDGVTRMRFVHNADGDLQCCKFEEWLDHRES